MGKTKIGTPNIMAPEMISNQKYNQKSDIWSLGCVIYKMMTFKYPYEADSILSFIIDFPALVAKL
jgi:NIMA (never in mitosis gene a)-related kinase